jgi:hypothetical protein
MTALLTLSGFKAFAERRAHYHEGTRDPRSRLGKPSAWSAGDPGRVKSPKGRSRRGIMFYQRRGFRVVLPLPARTLGLEKKAVLRVLHAPAF